MRARPWLPSIALVACAFACSDGAAIDRRSAILITLDTTRYDALGRAGITPNLDRVAARGVSYTQARTVAPLTLPAHASMFTGLYPPRHTVRGNGPTTLPLEASTVAERAQAAGFQTAGFVGGLTLDRAYGAAQGFESWSQPEISATRVLGQISDRPAAEVVADARAWLAARDRERPFLLWVHVFDAHAPYDPPASYLASAGGDAYLGEIASYDAELGRLLEDLEREGVLDLALTIVVADHGEARGDHGEDTHGLHAWDSTIRVPLIVRHPDGARAGEKSDELASVVDVAPTLLAWMQLEMPSDLDGVSLLGRVPLDRGVYFESFSGWARFGWSPIAGWCDRSGKYIHSSKPQLFDVRADPLELNDLHAEHDANLARYRDAIHAVLARPGLRSAQPQLADVANAHALAELGYGGGDAHLLDHPDPLEPTERPAPRERLLEALGLHQRLRRDERAVFVESLALLEPLVATNPHNVAALDELGAALVELERWSEAAEVLERRAALPPDHLVTRKHLVRCYTELGDAAKAREHTLRSLELLIETHELRGEPDAAARYRALLESETTPKRP